MIRIFLGLFGTVSDILGCLVVASLGLVSKTACYSSCVTQDALAALYSGVSALLSLAARCSELIGLVWVCFQRDIIASRNAR